MAATCFGGVELGGTKCVCLIGTGPDDIRHRVTIPTGSDAAATLTRLAEELRAGAAAHGPIQALGIASFGPIDLDRHSPGYGSITTTTKPGWRGAPVLARLAAVNVPTAIDTDVNGAALAEGRWGAARMVSDYAYVTVGTGVGVGLIVAGQPAGGFMHSELGHIRVVRQAGDEFRGSCAFHGDCVEGLACGPAIAARLGRPADAIGDDAECWDLVAHPLAQLLHTLMLATAPRRILLGGGVMEGRPALLPRIRRHLALSLNGYLDLTRLPGGLAHYVAAPQLGPLAGPLGALALAADAL